MAKLYGRFSSNKKETAQETNLHMIKLFKRRQNHFLMSWKWVPNHLNYIQWYTYWLILHNVLLFTAYISWLPPIQVNGDLIDVEIRYWESMHDEEYEKVENMEKRKITEVSIFLYLSRKNVATHFFLKKVGCSYCRPW